MASYGSFYPLHNSQNGKLRQLLPTSLLAVRLARAPLEERRVN